MPMPPMKAKIHGKDELVACHHWRDFPPPYPTDPTSLRAMVDNHEISNADMQRVQIWERICNKRKMDEACLQCEHVRVKVDKGQAHPPVLRTLDGKSEIPIVDIGTLETVAQHGGRDHLVTAIRPPGSKGTGTDAAWMKQAKDK